MTRFRRTKRSLILDERFLVFEAPEARERTGAGKRTGIFRFFGRKPGTTALTRSVSKIKRRQGP
jgi:hypothetical protein